MLSNREISRLFGLYAELLQLHEKESRLSDLLSGAAYRIGRMDDSVAEMQDSELKEQFRPELVKIIKASKTNGVIENLEELIQLTPQGLFDMMRIKGLGGKKLALLWKTAKIESVEALAEACRKNIISKIPGFGIKTEQNILAGIEALNSSKNRYHYADVADTADALVGTLQQIFDTPLLSLCGEVRRMNTTVESIEILAALSPKELKSPSVKKVLNVQQANDGITLGHTLDELPVKIYYCQPKEFYTHLFYKTGSDAHVKRIREITGKSESEISEEAIYATAGFPYIVPELREDVAEWDYLRSSEPLITLTDIKGVVHNHTTWSDGVDKLENFARACMKKGYEYVVISDHSQNAHYAGGLKPDKVLKQFTEIDRLNKQLSPFRIFKSIECDILVSGELDYDKTLLRQFDMVIASVHQLLKMTEEKATARLIKAIENPFTTILGHMTGRQLLIRPGYPVDFKKVIDACAANGVVIEINANPYRLDMDWSQIPYALERGVMISINPDSHSIYEIDNIRWGVCAARKGGLTKNMTWNAMDLKGIEKWLKHKKTKA